MPKKNGENYKPADFSLWIEDAQESYGTKEEIFSLFTQIAAEGKTNGK